MGHEPNYITALPFRGAQKVTLFRGTRMSPATACPEWSTHVPQLGVGFFFARLCANKRELGDRREASAGNHL